MNLTAAIINFISNFISTIGYPGLFFLMLLQSAGIPIPSEITMPFAGFLVFQGRFDFGLMILAATMGSVVGACIGYAIGRYGGRPLIIRYGKYVLISPHDLEITERFFTRFGSFAVLLGKLLPVLNTFVGLTGGVARQPFKKFLAFVLLGSLIWNTILGYAGLKLGPRWLVVRQSIQHLDLYILFIIFVFVICWVYRHVRHLRSPIDNP